MLSNKLQDALNQQINDEYYSSYLYQAMVAYLEDLNLDGCAHWMKMQAEEEHLHALKLFDYVVERGGRVELFAIAQPAKEWDSPRAAFEAALDHEKVMTENISKLADLAITERDHATNNLLQWYVSEQVEEEATVDDILKKLDMMGDTGTGLFLMDRELKNRPTPTPIDQAGA
ncbi:MAG: ferritin [Candidatus Krumholzibacteria bacterium]|nr:ferritin [Candidatus Krumholzibacteria bacterium]